jgi:CBS domain-containing membrane protein
MRFLSRPARWLAACLPAATPVSRRERLRASAGALIGIALTLSLTYAALGSTGGIPLLIAPIGASAVLLFGVPASPLAQPWSLLGGNLVSGLIGITCARWIADPNVAAALAVALALGAMFALRCVHPPSGAVALTAVLGGPVVHAMGYGFLLAPLGINSVLLLGSAIFYHRVTGHRYPHVARPVAQASAGAAEGLGFTRADLEAVLASRDELMDVDTGDLESLMRETELRAYGRRLNDLDCSRIMSSDIKYVGPDVAGHAAWEILRRHNIKALPVVDDSRRVVGIVTRADLLAHTRGDGVAQMARGLPWKWRRSGRQPMVRELMTSQVRTVDARQAVADLVPLFADYGHHHLPVVDAQKRLCGMITQSDLVQGLYRARLDDALPIAA